MDEIAKEIEKAAFRPSTVPPLRSSTARHRIGTAIEELKLLRDDLDKLIAALGAIQERL